MTSGSTCHTWARNRVTSCSGSTLTPYPTVHFTSGKIRIQAGLPAASFRQLSLDLPAAYAAAGLSFSGSNALPTDLLRPYQGFGNINIHQMGGNANYNSMQVSLQRRFASKLFVQLSYTWSKALGAFER